MKKERIFTFLSSSLFKSNQNKIKKKKLVK